MLILFTFASNPAAIALARVLLAEGHTVYAADEERVWGTSPARYSHAYARFYRLTEFDGIARVLDTIGNKLDLIIPFGALSSADREQLRSSGSVVIGGPLFQSHLDFQDFVREEVINMIDRSPNVVKLPVAYEVQSRMCIAEILSQYPSTTFLLQPLPHDDWDNEDTLVDIDDSITSEPDVTPDVESLVLSCTTLDDNVVEAIKRLPMSYIRPFRLIEIVEGGMIYSAHVFVNSGNIRTFTVTTTGGSENDSVLIPASRPLFNILHQFMERFVEALMNPHGETALVKILGKKQKALSTHLSVDFRIKDEVRSNGDFARKITAISCSTEPHHSLILLCSTPSIRRQLADAYFNVATDGSQPSPLILPSTSSLLGLYSIKSDMMDLFRHFHGLAPWNRCWWWALIRLLTLCWIRVLWFQEEMWSLKDLGPALCLWLRLLVGKCWRFLAW